ncbi:MAG: ABC transporter permease [Vulcanimicrobiota bacterium]
MWKKLGPLGRKIVISILTILIAITFTFILVRQMPGDIVHTLALQLQMQRGISYNEAREIAKAQLNYDPSVPVYIQYFKYITNLVFRGNLGMSLHFRIPVATIIKSALPWTILITSSSVILSFIIGTLLGTTVAWRRKSILDPIVTLYATVTQAIPDFLIGLILLVIFGVMLGWFPMRGAYGPDVTPGFNLAFIGSVLYHAILPIVAFSIQAVGGWALGMKASATSVLGEDYINVAKAKGLSEQRIIVNYLGKNAILPLITSVAIALGAMLGGSMLVETIFGYPGLGYFFAQAINLKDYSLIQGLFLITTVAIIFANLIADIIYTKLDPRIKLE